MITLFFFMSLVASSTGHTIDDPQSMLREDLELERRLNLINKPPIKSIEVLTHILIIGSLI